MSLLDAQAQVILARPIKRLSCFFIDLDLFLVTLGIGWIIWSVVEARHGLPGHRVCVS